jgi:hypothetical protein
VAQACITGLKCILQMLSIHQVMKISNKKRGKGVS